MLRRSDALGTPPLKSVPRVFAAHANDFGLVGNLVQQIRVEPLELSAGSKYAATPPERRQVPEKPERPIDRSVALRWEPVRDHQHGLHAHHVFPDGDTSLRCCGYQPPGVDWRGSGELASGGRRRS